MLAHSPILPLVIDYLEENNISAEDEQEAILALKQYDRVRRIRLQMPFTSLQRLIAAMDDDYPILEYLIIAYLVEDKSSISRFSETLQAPRLRHLVLDGFSLPIGSRLLTSAAGLVTFCLAMDHTSTYFHPNTLLQWLSFMPQLETLAIVFFILVPNRDVERQLTHTPITTPVTLHSLHAFRFQGVRTYLEAFVHQITTPRLEKLQIFFFNQLTFSIPRLLQLLSAIENIRFKSAKFHFSDEEVHLELYPHEETGTSALSMAISCWHLDWQVSSAAEISDSLGPMFSAVEHLALEHRAHSRSSEEHNEADLTEWRRLLGSFRNVKTLHIAPGLVEELSRCLQLDEGELPLELLPELQELSGNTGDAITSFIDARQDVGHPITLVRCSLSPYLNSSMTSFEPSSITPESSEEGSDFDV